MKLWIAASNLIIVIANGAQILCRKAKRVINRFVLPLLDHSDGQNGHYNQRCIKLEQLCFEAFFLLLFWWVEIHIFDGQIPIEGF